MLLEHHPDRASLAWDAARLERRKQQVLFLGMMTGVGEGAEELDTRLQRFRTASSSSAYFRRW